MAERITHITTTAFRGVVDSWSVDLPAGSSLIVHGDNGTGKSTIADALEFYFKGHIDFLRPEGRAGAIRHVGASAATPTSVEVQTTGVLGGSVAGIGGRPPPQALQVGSRETFLLRGRTLVEFIEKPKGEKWKALAEILGLEAMDHLRLDLQTVKNELTTESGRAAANLSARAKALAPRVAAVAEAEVLSAIQDKCKEAGVTPPATLDAAFDPAWLETISAADEGSRRGMRFRSLVASLKGRGSVAQDLQAAVTWNNLVASTTAASRVRLVLFQAAQDYERAVPFEDRCPLCDQPISSTQLSDGIRAVLDSLAEAAATLQSAEAGIGQLVGTLESAESFVLEQTLAAERLGVEVKGGHEGISQLVKSAVRERRVVPLDGLASYSEAFGRWCGEAAKSVEAAVPRPETAQTKALVALGALVADARAWHTDQLADLSARRAASRATEIFAAYQAAQRSYFDRVLMTISGRVAQLYSSLHPEEGLGSVDVGLWTDKGVELSIDFHGTRQRPPHGVLSESHLNSLAIALFLAMAEAFNQELGFLVLDDVVNSFDARHRGQLARLLTEEFQAWQLIVLTHDPIFFERVRRLAKGWLFLEITSWSYDLGPRTTRYQSGTMLEKAELQLGESKVAAAVTGRRALEELLQEICESLGADLRFRRGVRNDRRECGELLVGLRRLLKKHKRGLVEELDPLLRAVEADLAGAFNVESHASMAAASAEEIRQALTNVRTLDARWTCAECHRRVWHKGDDGPWQCECGRLQFPPAVP